MKTNIGNDISQPIQYLTKFWVSCYGPKCCQPIKSHDSLKCNISMISFIFGMQINIEIFYKLILSFWVCVTRHAQSTQNKFAYLAIYLKKHGGEEVKWNLCLQINTKIFYKLIESLWVCIARHAQSTENNKFTISLQYLKENMED